MGVLIKIAGATFTDEKYIIGKVDIPEVECEHAYDNACDTTCNLCGAVRTVQHNLVHVDAVAPTDTENGNVEYWHCTVCDGYWLDKACTQPTTADDVVLLSIGSYPVQDTLKGLYDLGSGEDGTNDSLANHAPNPVATGTPSINGDTHTVHEDYITFDGAGKNRMTPMLPTHALENGIALIALFSNDATGSIARPLISNRRATASARECGMALYNDRVAIAVEGEDTPATFTFKDPIYTDNFAILAFVGDTNGFRVLRYSNGALANVEFKRGNAADAGEYMEEYVGSVNGWNTNVFQIGGDGTGNSFYTPTSISLAAIHEGVVTNKQLMQISQFVKAYGEQKGLTIE